ncbi:MAG: sigma-70 family RNA polymerase sigma factor [Sedimentisphaerales bacterium]|nr:sigma-70 family RNA polymerase sigma factor [Sedimentisphaerales bacterium]
MELLDRSGARLFALLTRLTLREDVAEELMQELFLKLSHAPQQATIDCWYAYARRVAINLAFDWRRRHRRRQTVPLEGVSEPISGTRGPVGDLLQAEESEQVLAAIGRLQGASRELFVMRYLQQDSYEDIATQLGKTPHQVRALCFRAMKEVREILGCNRGPRSEKGVLRVEHE